MNVNGVKLTAAAAIAAAAAACSSSHPAVTVSASRAANPVPVLKLTGCPVPAGEVNGHLGADQDRVADCTFPGGFGESVSVFTYPTVAYRDNRAAHPLAPPQDGSWTIKGPKASLIIVDRPQGWTGPSPQKIAARTGGTLVKG